MNKLISQALDDLGKLAGLQNRFVSQRLGKEEKERVLGEIRALRKSLGFSELPPYNTDAFGQWVERHRVNLLGRASLG